MGERLSIVGPAGPISGSIRLSGSKSISNRVLLLDALTPGSVDISGLSDSDDTRTLQQLLGSTEDVLDTGHAGTTYRFLTAYLATREGQHVLTGSDRMLQRPIGPLVDALRSIGASITYVGKEGYPPLKIGAYDSSSYQRSLTIAADVSSQYISALLMIATTLPDGLRLRFDGEIVSRPYIEMTLRIMRDFGAVYQWVDDHTIDIPSQQYTRSHYEVEADWSAASYYYSIAAIAPQCEIKLQGLTNQELQGDHQISHIGIQQGVCTQYTATGLLLKKDPSLHAKSLIEYDFVTCPDIAQTVMAMCGALGRSGLYTGLQTLHIKETDRIQAMQTELAKMQVYLSKLPAKFTTKPGTYYMQEGKAVVDHPTFSTYHDHRMAMALAPLAVLGPVSFDDPMVVSKSYPRFWEDLTTLGFTIS